MKLATFLSVRGIWQKASSHLEIEIVQIIINNMNLWREIYIRGCLISNIKNGNTALRNIFLVFIVENRKRYSYSDSKWTVTYNWVPHVDT